MHSGVSSASGSEQLIFHGDGSELTLRAIRESAVTIIIFFLGFFF